MSIDISKLKNRWAGVWNPTVIYKVNDIVQYRGSSYVCIQDIPERYVVAGETGVSTNYYTYTPPTVVLKTIDPKDTDYWLDMAPGMTFRKTWEPRTRYNVGDIVELAGDLYICINGNVKNTYVTDSTYWTKVFESGDRDQRYVCADLWNQQPLGWTRNNGDSHWGNSGCGYMYGFLGYDGNVYLGGMHYRGAGTGSNAANAAGASNWSTPCFSFVDWLNSTQNGGTGRLTTPDGEAPKCIQWIHQGGDTTAASGGNSLFLMNNGEVYSTGYNGTGQLGIGNTTEWYHPVRVSNTKLTDWRGNIIPRNFDETKIVKVTMSGVGFWNNGYNSCYALGDDGTVWVWGRNDRGQLGLGPESGTTNGFGLARTDQTRPERLPQSFFNHRKIVDIMACGGNSSLVFAIDEDEYLWAWGISIRGGTGLADTHVDTGYTIGKQHTPQQIGIDWKRNGGIKKIMMSSDSGNYERTWLLDGNGFLWFAGEIYSNGLNQTAQGTNSGTTSMQTTKFTRLERHWFGEHYIENFWALDNRDGNIILREKGTGLTYIIGGNQEGQLGMSINHKYYDSSWNIFPSLIHGVRYLRDVINSSNNYVDAGTTIVALTDDGEVWTRGYNNHGSGSIGYSGSSWVGTGEAEYETSSNTWQRSLLPPGEYCTGLAAFGPTSSGDGVIYRLATGGIMICGTDGTANSQQMQGHIHSRSFSTLYHWYTMHSYPG